MHRTGAALPATTCCIGAACWTLNAPPALRRSRRTHPIQEGKAAALLVRAPPLGGHQASASRERIPLLKGSAPARGGSRRHAATGGRPADVGGGGGCKAAQEMSVAALARTSAVSGAGAFPMKAARRALQSKLLI